MNGKLRKILMAVLAAVFVTGIGLSVYQSYQYAQAQQLQDRAQQLVQVPEPKPVELLPEVDTPLAPAPEMDENAKELAKLELTALQQENPDVLGWITIPETKISYPLMAAYTPDEYLHTAWDGSYNYAGSIYLECQNDRELSDFHSLIYGHNMANGSQFRTIMYYQQQNYWKEHPRIYFSTLYEEREYEVLAAFYDRIYYKAEKCFKYYEFLDPETEEEFNEGIEYFKSHSLYDTGVDAEWGDQLLTLVTCAYHVEDGRFVVVARMVEDEPVEETTAPTENEA